MGDLRHKMIFSINIKFFKNWIPAIILFFVIMLLWEISLRMLDVPQYLIPLPSKISIAVIDEMKPLLINTCITMTEAILGFLIANISGIVLAVGFVHSKIIERSIYPYAIALKAVPLVAVAPLLTMWFGNGMLGKVIMAGVISFFPVLVNAAVGLKSVAPEAVDLMQSLSATRWQILTKLRFPIALPYIFSGLKISSTLSVIGPL